MAVPRSVVQLEVPEADVELAADALWQGAPSAVLEVELGGGRVRLVADVADPTAAIGLAPGWSRALLAVDDDAYLDAWRTWAAPIRAGLRTLLHPAWLPRDREPGGVGHEEPGPTPPGSRGWVDGEELVVLLDPGRAFGSGSHESTRLAVAELEARVVPGVAVLDVGCGSGVLAVVACLLGAGSATCIDLDPAALEATVANAAANGVGHRVRVAPTELADVEGTFGLVVANIGGRVLFDLAPALRRRVAPAGLLVASGILDDQVDALVAALAPLEEVARSSEAGWSAVVLAAPGP